VQAYSQLEAPFCLTPILPIWHSLDPFWHKSFCAFFPLFAAAGFRKPYGKRELHAAICRDGAIGITVA
jgi:hypothetical protein